MATVYLHIGLPKTGSTTIQVFTCDNREVFEKFGICYPLFDYSYEMVSFRRNGHFLFAPYVNEDGKLDRTRPAAEYEEGLNKLEEISKQYDKILLTDEGLWWGSHTRENFWEQLKEDMNKRGLDVRIIVYLRRQDSWIESHWAQNIRDGRTCLTMHDYLDYMKDRGYPLDYYAYISKFAEIFGKDHLHIKILERGQFKGAEHTLQSDFLDIFGLSLSDGFRVKQDVYNAKFEGNYLEIKRLMNLLPELRTRKHIVFDGITKLDLKNPAKRDYSMYSFFAPEDRKVFREQFEESNRRLAVEFLGREDGILFYDPPKDLPELTINEGDLLRDSILLYGKIFDIIQKQNEAAKEQLAGQEGNQTARQLALKHTVYHMVDKRMTEHERVISQMFQQVLDKQLRSIRDMKAELKAEQKKNIQEMKKELRDEQKQLIKNLKKELREELKADLQKNTKETKALQSDLKALREDVLFYRLKRKIRHIKGSDQ